MKANKRTVIALVIAGIILAVTTIGNASADLAVYQNFYYTKHLGTSATKLNDARNYDNPVWVWETDTLGWNNAWWNANSFSEYGGMGYYCTELSISPNPGVPLSAYYQTDLILRSGTLGGNPGDYEITNINHVYYGSTPPVSAPSNLVLNFKEW